MNDFRNLNVWKLSFSLCADVHRYCNSMPKNEQFSIAEQMRRCSLSIPSNIAEGKGRMSDKEMRRFCLIAYGSAMELQTQILLYSELKMIHPEHANDLIQKLIVVLRLLNKPPRSKLTGYFISASCHSLKEGWLI
jgi:four helix bundle protein